MGAFDATFFVAVGTFLLAGATITTVLLTHRSNTKQLLLTNYATVEQYLSGNHLVRECRAVLFGNKKALEYLVKNYNDINMKSKKFTKNIDCIVVELGTGEIVSDENHSTELKKFEEILIYLSGVYDGFCVLMEKDKKLLELIDRFHGITLGRVFNLISKLDERWTSSNKKTLYKSFWNMGQQCYVKHKTDIDKFDPVTDEPTKSEQSGRNGIFANKDVLK
jgi:hypothetical protein